MFQRRQRLHGHLGSAKSYSQQVRCSDVADVCLFVCLILLFYFLALTVKMRGLHVETWWIGFPCSFQNNFRIVFIQLMSELSFRSSLGYLYL